MTTTPGPPGRPRRRPPSRPRSRPHRRPPPTRDTEPEAEGQRLPFQRGGCRCLCEHLTALDPGGECAGRCARSRKHARASGWTSRTACRSRASSSSGRLRRLDDCGRHRRVRSAAARQAQRPAVRPDPRVRPDPHQRDRLGRLAPRPRIRSRSRTSQGAFTRAPPAKREYVTRDSGWSSRDRCAWTPSRPTCFAMTVLSVEPRATGCRRFASRSSASRARRVRTTRPHVRRATVVVDGGWVEDALRGRGSMFPARPGWRSRSAATSSWTATVRRSTPTPSASRPSRPATARPAALSSRHSASGNASRTLAGRPRQLKPPKEPRHEWKPTAPSRAARHVHARAAQIRAGHAPPARGPGTADGYTRELSRLMFRSLFGCGVICGLVVKPEPKCGQDSITVACGLALDCPATRSTCQGTAIVLDENCEPRPRRPALGRAVRHGEVLRAAARRCARRTTTRWPSMCTRERDGFEIRVVADAPSAPARAWTRTRRRTAGTVNTGKTAARRTAPTRSRSAGARIRPQCYKGHYVGDAVAAATTAPPPRAATASSWPC